MGTICSGVKEVNPKGGYTLKKEIELQEAEIVIPCEIIVELGCIWI